MSKKIDKLTLKAIKRVNRIATIGVDLRSKVARTGKPSAKRQRREWRSGKMDN